MSAPRMAFTVIDRVFIVVHGPRDPTDEEWMTYLDAVEQHGVDRTMVLIFTEGGAPVAMQRRYLYALLRGRSVPVAVLTSSVVIRGAVTGLSWFNRKIHAFPPAGVREAIKYLEIPTSRTALIEREVEKLRRALEEGGHGRDR